MGHYSFKKDILDGERGEELLVKFLCDNFNAVFIGKSEKDEFKFWDLKFKFNEKGEVTYEVKTDVYVSKGRTLSNGFYAKGYDTGNIFIEFETRGKPSGVNVTKADWWVNIYYYLGEMWFIKVDHLKKIISENNFEIKDNDVGDVNSGTKGFIIPRKKFKKDFVVKYF
jgi:hypothetical protein